MPFEIEIIKLTALLTVLTKEKYFHIENKWASLLLCVSDRSYIIERDNKTQQPNRTY